MVFHGIDDSLHVTHQSDHIGVNAVEAVNNTMDRKR
jgi:hypothetical protein